MWIKKISGDFPEGVIARYFHIPSDGSRRYGTFCFQVKDEPKAGTVEFGYKKAFTLYNAYNYEEALKLFLFVYTNFPKHRLAPDAMFMAGQCLAVMKSYKESIAVHKALIASYPKSYCVAHAYFRIACLTAGLLEKHEEGIELFTNIIKLFPTDPIAQDSLFCIAALHLIDENTQQATEEFALLATKYPNSYRGKAAKANLAELANVSK
jgi:TolA-binding protein